MRLFLRALPPLGFIISALLISVAYAENKPPNIVTTMSCVLACIVTAVWVWREDNP